VYQIIVAAVNGIVYGARINRDNGTCHLMGRLSTRIASMRAINVDNSAVTVENSNVLYTARLNVPGGKSITNAFIDDELNPTK
jgi:hypothetical protein